MTESEIASRRPAAVLRGLVDHYDGYAFADAPVGVHRGLPSRYLTVVLTLDAPLQLTAMPDPAQAPGSFDALIGGLHSAPAGIRMGGPSAGIQLALTPAGARALFDAPAGKLRSSVVSLDDVIGAEADRLVARLRDAPSWPARFAVLDETLTRRLTLARHAARPEVVWAWDRLVRRHGNAAVAAIADEVGWSRRHLTAQFDAELGLTPKMAGRVLRFESSVALLRAHPRARLADVAADCGYADQAHMTRDWGRLAGCPPSRWLAEEYAYVVVAPDAVHAPAVAAEATEVVAPVQVTVRQQDR